MASDEKPSGFKVTDRRSFNQESAEVTPERPVVDAPPEAASAGTASGAAFPPVDFHTFVLSLGSSALLHLGELEDPEAGAPQKDLALAKHTIDLLEMLEQKTKGNLTPPEEKLIESLLYDLRLRYVEATRAQPK
jgi:hypothetical protein